MLRVKICGVTTPDDIGLCAEAGADAVGLNFHPASPRYIDPRNCGPLVRAMPPFLTGVGVFVNQPIRQMSAIAYQLGLSAIQHHGDYPAPDDPFPFRLIAAVRVRDQRHLDELSAYLAACRTAGRLPAAVLIDAYVEGQHGGTGQNAPWGLLAGLKIEVPLILAGGLTPENVADAIRQVRPAAVDVASGVEISPGRKDPDKVRRFIANAREADAGM